MNRHSKRAAVFFLLLLASALFTIIPASARGAAVNIMNSPGYQRALEESRKRYQQSAEPRVQPSKIDKRKKSRPH